MSEPETAAGRALLDDIFPVLTNALDLDYDAVQAIRAIEAEARAKTLDEVAALVAIRIEESTALGNYARSVAFRTVMGDIDSLRAKP